MCVYEECIPVYRTAGSSLKIPPRQCIMSIEMYAWYESRMRVYENTDTFPALVCVLAYEINLGRLYKVLFFSKKRIIHLA